MILIPGNIAADNIVVLSNESDSKYRCLRYPILPSNLLKLITKSHQQPEDGIVMDVESNFNILIVDDNPLIPKSLERLLQTLNVKLISKAKNGQEAFDIVNESDEIFHIIFMDISMPVMNGIETTKMIRELKNEKKKKHNYLCIDWKCINEIN